LPGFVTCWLQWHVKSTWLCRYQFHPCLCCLCFHASVPGTNVLCSSYSSGRRNSTFVDRSVWANWWFNTWTGAKKTILNADVFFFNGLISQGLCMFATSHTKLRNIPYVCTPQFLSHGFPRRTGRGWWQRRTFLKRDEWVWWAACPKFQTAVFFWVSISKSGAWCIMDSNHARRDDFLNPGTFVAVVVGLLLGCCWIAQLG